MGTQLCLFNEKEMNEMVKKGISVIEDYKEKCETEERQYFTSTLLRALRIPKKYFETELVFEDPLKRTDK